MKQIDGSKALYILLMILIFTASQAFGQITAYQYNAEWNSANKVEWMNELTDCKVGYIDIAVDKESQKKLQIVVVPTIIIFKDGEEVKRFQADISFSMKATREEVQEVIDEQLMSDF